MVQRRKVVVMVDVGHGKRAYIGALVENDTDRRMVRFDAHGETLFVVPENVYSSARIAEPHGPWRVVHREGSRRKRAAEQRQRLTPAETAALDERVLRDVGFDPHAINTPTALYDRIFVQRDWNFDEVSGDLSEAAACLWYKKRKGVSTVKSSLERLVREGKLAPIYGLGLNGKETRMYTLPE